MTQQIPQRILLLIALWVVGGCTAPNKRADGPAREVLPFVVKIGQIELPPADGQGKSAIPPDFGDPERIRAALARALDEAGVFTLVLAEDDPLVPADLQLDVAIRGRDFGAGELLVGGATFSTIVWLFAGPCSWMIDDRKYPGSNVRMDVRIHQLKDDSPDVFDGSILLNNLELSFVERAAVDDWFLNIFLPPSWGDGDPELAARSLGRRAVEQFRSQVPTEIRSRLPRQHRDQLASFLVHNPETDELIVLPRGGAINRIDISALGRASRELTPEVDTPFDASRREAVRDYLSRLPFDVGMGDDDRFYIVPLADGEHGFVRITAVLDDYRSDWTIYREPDVAARRDLAAGK